MTLETLSLTSLAPSQYATSLSQDPIEAAQRRGYEQALVQVARNMRNYGLGWVNIAIATGLEISELKKKVENS
ncbi:hypothetical protein Bealeia1_01961 (plasmid) [Candidatus Bealeia paramacronuclearis]|uniref:Uncharacterized protein n=1 Tax=Candidatus Bealeia paramacronuclearis TaxID=1921001 RepID=A0ABZ2C9C2_9PROT|nr:hypothetical protein [Candidatus Bealeia paramacronuclearis]